MSHQTPFEQMNATQRSLHNLCNIIEDRDELTYMPAISAAIDEIAALSESLRRYGRHAPSCRIVTDEKAWSNYECSCGLTEAIAKARGQQ